MYCARRRAFQALLSSGYSLTSLQSSSIATLALRLPEPLRSTVSLPPRRTLAAPWAAIQRRGAKVLGSDVRTGNVIQRKGRTYEILKAQHTQHGRGGATMQVELRDIDSGTKVTERLRTDEVLEVSRYYAQDRRRYDLFRSRSPGDQEFRRAWAEDVDEDDSLWTGSDEDEDDRKDDSNLKKEIKKLKKTAKENADLIDADDSDELRSLCSESDEEMNLWSGTEDDDDDDIPTEPHPNERSDHHIDKLFDFDSMPKNRTFADIMDAVNAENEPPQQSPAQHARKLAVDNALKKLKKGPDGRYINVWEVMSDIDILIGAFENIVSGPEYAELREGGPKKIKLAVF